MKIFEIILSVIFLIGLLFKMMHWPGGSAIIVFSLTILTYYYFIFSFVIFNSIKLKRIFKKDSYESIGSFKIIMSILLGWSLSILVSGMMYKLQNWKNQIDLLLLGLAHSIIILTIYLIFYKNKDKRFWMVVFMRYVIIIAIGLFVYLGYKS